MNRLGSTHWTFEFNRLTTGPQSAWHWKSASGWDHTVGSGPWSPVNPRGGLVVGQPDAGSTDRSSETGKACWGRSRWRTQGRHFPPAGCQLIPSRRSPLPRTRLGHFVFFSILATSRYRWLRQALQADRRLSYRRIRHWDSYRLDNTTRVKPVTFTMWETKDPEPFYRIISRLPTATSQPTRGSCLCSASQHFGTPAGTKHQHDRIRNHRGQWVCEFNGNYSHFKARERRRTSRNLGRYTILISTLLYIPFVLTKYFSFIHARSIPAVPYLTHALRRRWF